MNDRGSTDRPLRLGILGAARIAPFAVIKHARVNPDVDVVAVAEEYQPAAHLAKYAAKHGIERTFTSFDELLASPDIDAVYIPLPIGMHADACISAIEAGKHVLCEKPFTANAADAERVREVARRSDRVVAEAMHFRYHPLVDRVRHILREGEIGALTHIDASFSALLPFDDFRFHYETGGGGTIDMGCYPIGFIRAVTEEEPEVIHAEAGLHGELIDRWMRTRMRLRNGCDVRVFVGMRCSRLLSASMRLVGERGQIDILNFIKPEVYHRLKVRSPRGKRVEKVAGGSTYAAQLAAFAQAVKRGEAPRTDVDDAVKNMRVIDAVYRAAGLPVRGDADVLARLKGSKRGSNPGEAWDVKGKNVLVTGPTSGIGRGTALALAERGARLILVARSAEKCAAVAREITERGAPEPMTILADLSLLSQVERVAEAFLATGEALHVLVNNAGLVNQRRRITSEGLEETMAVNYFAPFALTLRLLPAIRRAGRARVVNVTSNSYPIGRLDFDDLTFSKFYWPLGPYAASKLGNIYFTRELARRLEGTGVTTNAVHPGLIFTNLGVGNNPGRWQAAIASIWQLFSLHESEGHRCPVYAATAPELEGVSGKYIADEKVAKPKAIALRDAPARRLWELSEGMTGVRFPAT